MSEGDPPATATAVMDRPPSNASDAAKAMTPSSPSPSKGVTPVYSAEINRLVKSVRALPRSSRAVSGGSKRVWQIVAVPLRVWATDPASGRVVRPYYNLALELYPSGTVSGCGRVQTRVDVPPPASELLRFALAAMAEPVGDNAPRVRPDVVTFVDAATTAAATPALTAAGIEPQTLSLADGVAEYVASLSAKMVEKDTAAVGDASNHPGLLRTPGVTVSVLRSLHDSAALMAAARPWRVLPESIALRFTSLDGRVYYVSVFGSDGDATGFVAAPSLVALQAKFTRATGRGAPVFSEGEDVPTVYGGEVVTCAACGRRLAERGQTRRRAAAAAAAGITAPGVGDGKSVGGGSADGTDDTSGSLIDRCSRCHVVHYCGPACQARDWVARHRAECTDAEAGPRLAPRHEAAWTRRELALLLCDPTAVPFDDLDVVAEHGLAPVTGDPDKPKPDGGGVLYPVPFVTVAQGGAVGADAAGGQPPSLAGGAKPGVDRPILSEIEFLDAAARALAELEAPPQRGLEVAAQGLRICTERNMAAEPAPPASLVEEIDVTGA